MNPEEIQIQNIKKHRLGSWAKELMARLPALSERQYEQVGKKNNGPYRNEYPKLPIKDNNEPLVNCFDYGLISKDYYLGKLLDGEKIFMPGLKRKMFFPFAWLRKSVAKRLQGIDKYLRKHDLFLVVNSGWRHPEVQSLAIKSATKKYGQKKSKQRFAKTSAGQRKLVTPHSTGGACDLELWSLQINSPLSFSYPRDVISFYELEMKNGLGPIEKTKRDIRRILFHCLATPGICLDKGSVFVIHPGEFWHFGSGDPLSAYLARQKFAKYGETKPPEDYKICPF